MIDRIKMIKEYAQKKENEHTEQISNKEKKCDELCNIIFTMKDDIKEIIEVGKACIENGICINGYKSQYAISASDESNFYTNGISHRVGFYGGKAPHGDFREHCPIIGIGIKNGGANGYFDLFIDENGTADAYNQKDGKYGYIGQLNDCLERFIKEFPLFKEKFYNYVDSVCGG